MIYILVVAAIFTADYCMKKYREEHTGEKSLLQDNVKITTYHNHGAFLNLGDQKPMVVKAVSVVLTAILTIVFLMTLGKHGKRSLKLGLAFLLGGAFSNTYDRLTREYVVDYLTFPTAPGYLKTIIFNISDFFILIGSLMSILAH